MSKRIEYIKNEELGPFKTKFLEDIANTNPRKAYFICSFCGKTFKANISKIKSGHTRSCGCQSGRKNNFKYQINDAVGPNNNILIKRITTAPNYICEFKCSKCDNTFQAPLGRVVSGQKCYCEQCHLFFQHNFGKRQANSQKRKDAVEKSISKIYPGQKYGHLTVLEKTNKTKNTKRIWKCQCDCENKTIIEVRSDLLLNGHTQSCGCLGSLGEQKISQCLIKLGYSFVSQKIFNDCVNPKTNAKLRFDFYLLDYNICIEYDGEQHFKNTSGWFDKSSLEEIQYRDEIKNQFCKDNNIKLIRIPYTDYDKINTRYIKEILNEI